MTESGCSPSRLLQVVDRNSKLRFLVDTGSEDSKPTYTHKDLYVSPFVLVRADAVKKPLQPPYDGPYKVFQRNSKYFILDRNGTKDSVSIYRLKLTYLEPPPTPAPAVRAHLPRPPTQANEVTVPPPSPHHYHPFPKMLRPLQFQHPYLSITNPITLVPGEELPSPPGWPIMYIH
nr:gag pol polyprotein [Hymenolepis microstoma]